MWSSRFIYVYNFSHSYSIPLFCVPLLSLLPPSPLPCLSPFIFFYLSPPERLNSCTALPLPSVPFGYNRHSERASSSSATTGRPTEEDKENEYEELVSFKKDRGQDREKAHPEPLQPIDCNTEATSAI